jgi:hypothetical protein
VLYYQLGSYDQARGYLQTALEMPDVTPELRQKIVDLLEIVDKKLRPDQFSGFAETGLRYQSNASLGPGAQTVLASGGTINNTFLAHPDWNWFGTVGVNYVHDFETQTGETFEASIIGYDAQQFKLNQFDIGLLELRAGPRFTFAPGDPNGVSVKPYVVATGATLADAFYMGGIGGGLTLHAAVANVSLDPYFEIVQQTFHNSTLYPLASGLDGTVSTYGLQASGPVASGLSWQTRIAYAHADNQFAFDSYDSFAAPHFTRFDLKPCFENPRLPILQPDPMRGGLTELRKIATVADTWGMTIAPHLFPELNVQLLASIPNGLWIEDMGLADDIWVEPVPVVKGIITAPERPGHGLAFRPEILRNCAVKN